MGKGLIRGSYLEFASEFPPKVSALALHSAEQREDLITMRFETEINRCQTEGESDLQHVFTKTDEIPNDSLEIAVAGEAQPTDEILNPYIVPTMLHVKVL